MSWKFFGDSTRTFKILVTRLVLSIFSVTIVFDRIIKASIRFLCKNLKKLPYGFRLQTLVVRPRTAASSAYLHILLAFVRGSRKRLLLNKASLEKGCSCKKQLLKKAALEKSYS